MSRPRFLADHDFRDRILRGLKKREPSVDLVRVREVGLERAPDDQILEYAAAENRIVLSHDVNTMSAAAIARINTGEPMWGLILAIQAAKPSTIIDDVLLFWTVYEADDLRNEIHYLPL
jgi:predicted nuclease of predicted toxin-antitoxin system